MRAEPSVHPLREMAGRLAAVQRDRGEGLYIAHGAIPFSEYFLQQDRFGLTVLFPSDLAIVLLEDWLVMPDVFGFERFVQFGCEHEDRVLLAHGLKLMETNCREEDVILYERSLRRRAAVLLRTHSKSGGRTLPLCMRIAQWLIEGNPLQ